jgi:hypothetical protein
MNTTISHFIDQAAHSQTPDVAAAGPHLDADIAKVQEWLRHANIATTRIYNRRRSRPEGLPTKGI